MTSPIFMCTNSLIAYRLTAAKPFKNYNHFIIYYPKKSKQGITLEEIKCLCLAIENMRSDNLFYDDIYDQSQHICEEHGVNIPSVSPRKLPVRRDENWKNQFVFETKKEEIRVSTMYPLIDSLVQGIDKRFNQKSTSIITGVGKMLKFELSKDDINLLTNHFDLSKGEFVSEIHLLKARNKDDILTNKDCAFWLKWLRENGIETIFFQHRKPKIVDSLYGKRMEISYIREPERIIEAQQLANKKKSAKNLKNK
ncbi:hypothetical protein QTP88_022598 [Uroleucon formosanum]